jgi:hypothetical protein
MSQLAQQHQWQFGSHAGGGSEVAISAVCTSCGLARLQVVSTGSDQHIDLRGSCSGTPQEPGEPPQGEWPHIGALRDDAPPQP